MKEPNTAMQQIADAISTIATPVQLLTLPPSPTLDDVDGLFLILGSQLRQQTEERKRTLILEILQFMHKKLYF